MAEIILREAALEDAAEIHSLLLTLAPEIPLRVEKLEDEERLYALTRNCARSGESWVALDETGRIVGFVLAEPAQLRRHYAESEALELHYAGVAPERRKQGIFTQLLQKVLGRMLPVTTSINPQNRWGAAIRLGKLGFGETGAAGGERRLRWEPGTR